MHCNYFGMYCESFKQLIIKISVVNTVTNECLFSSNILNPG